MHKASYIPLHTLLVDDINLLAEHVVRIIAPELIIQRIHITEKGHSTNHLTTSCQYTIWSSTIKGEFLGCNGSNNAHNLT